MTTPGDTPASQSPPVPPDPAAPGSSSTSSRAHSALLVAVLILLCLMMRLSGLTALPVFGDEAIYLRWAQLIRGEGLTNPLPQATAPAAGFLGGGGHPWISLADPKPPLHFWLIALVLHGSADPLFAARHISVAAAAISIPLLYALCVELGYFLGLPRHRGTGFPVGDPAASPPPRTPLADVLPTFATGRILGLLSIAFFIFCPFLSFYQRLATADALFVAESLAIVWLSLRWSRLSLHPPRPASPWLAALFLGIAIGAALLTRQGISYTLCALPALAWLFHRFFTIPSAPTTKSFRQILISLFQLLLAALVAAVLWMPYLTAELAPRALETKREALPVDQEATLTSADLVAEVKRRIFYQDQFTRAGGDSRAAIVARNLRLAFIPGKNERGVLSSGWLFIYLTPPVYLASLLGFLYLAFRRRWLLLVFLLFWILLAMGPVILLGNVIYSRYILAGVPPFLIAAAYLFGDFIGITFTRFERAPAIPWIAAAIVCLALFFPSLKEIGIEATHWPRQTLTAADNYQYISGWPAGFAARSAITYLDRLAKEGPLIVITDNGWGTPADALWIYLSRNPNIHLYYTDRQVILDPVPGQRSTYWLRRDKWLFPPYEMVTLGSRIPVFYVTKEHSTPVLEDLRVQNPNISLHQTFYGIVNPRTGTSDPEGAVSIFQLSTPER